MVSYTGLHSAGVGSLLLDHTHGQLEVSEWDVPEQAELSVS